MITCGVSAIRYNHLVMADHQLSFLVRQKYLKCPLKGKGESVGHFRKCQIAAKVYAQVTESNSGVSQKV